MRANWSMDARHTSALAYAGTVDPTFTHSVAYSVSPVSRYSLYIFTTAHIDLHMASPEWSGNSAEFQSLEVLLELPRSPTIHSSYYQNHGVSRHFDHPVELRSGILRQLPTVQDILAAVKTNRSWCSRILKVYKFENTPKF